MRRENKINYTAIDDGRIKHLNSANDRKNRSSNQATLTNTRNITFSFNCNNVVIELCVYNICNTEIVNEQRKQKHSTQKKTTKNHIDSLIYLKYKNTLLKYLE